MISLRRLSAPVGVVLGLAGSAAALAAPSTAPAGSLVERARSLVAQMTTAEKLSLVEGDTVLEGNGTGVNACVGHISGVARLGLPALCMGDGPEGVGNGLTGVTQFPAPIVLASSWDPELAREFGEAMGAEHAAKGRNVVLAPTINIIRTPLWGRVAETLSEDPVLTAEMAAPIVAGLQSNGVIATPKHFVANNQEWLRLGDAPQYRAIDAVVSERALREIYLPAFRASVERGRAGALMCAYNRINGVQACENAPLLAIPRREWGFDGFIVSDWYFAHRSTEASVAAALDISMPGGASPFGFPDFYGAPLREALASNRISAAEIDAMATHVVAPMLRLGLVDHPVSGSAGKDARSPAHRDLALRMVEEGTVLLRNEGRALPLGPEVRSIAVIGDDAGPHVQTTERYGGFVSSAGLKIETPLEAIRRRAGPAVSVRYAPGTLGVGALPALPAAVLRTPGGEPGLRASYFADGDLSGAPVLVRTEAQIDSADARPAGLPELWSARWEGVLTPPRDGVYRFSITGGGEISLVVDGERVVFTPKQNFSGVTQGVARLQAGRPVSVRLDYSRASTLSPAELRLGWQAPDPALIDQAVAAARTSDAAVIFVSDQVSEGADRTSLALPGDQDALIEAVAAANPRTIVVLHTAGPVLMPWRDRIAGVLAGWYAGEEAAEGLAAVLFGDVDPSGRLPVTFPVADTQGPTASPARYPGSGVTVRYDEGLEVGYRGYDAKGEDPLYPFGFGLSYTRFAFSGAHAVRLGDGRWKIRVTVRNTGDRPGAAVAQLYLGYPKTAGEPPRQLRAFQRVALKPSESRRLSFVLPPEDFRVWDAVRHNWRTVPGFYTVGIGASSRDLPITFPLSTAAPR